MTETGYDYLFKNNRLLISYCLWIFCNLIIAKMHFFPKRVVEILKIGHLPVKLHPSAPLPTLGTKASNSNCEFYHLYLPKNY